MNKKFVIFIMVVTIAALISLLVMFALKEEQAERNKRSGLDRIGDTVAATYIGGKVTAQELRAYINKMMPRREHMSCKKHGSKHSQCSPDEKCENHPLNSVDTYRMLLRQLVMEKMVDRWIREKGMLARKDVTHKLKHLVEEINLNALSGKMHSDKLKPDQVEMRQYYEQRRDEYQSRPFAEVEKEIERILIARKQAEYIPKYIEELKKNAVIERNYDLIKVSEPTDSEIRNYYEEHSSKYKRPESIQVQYMVFQNGENKAVQEKAEKALIKIRAGGNFKKIADEFADSFSSAEYLEKNNSSSKSPKFLKTVFRYRKGETTAVFQDGGALYIAGIIERLGSKRKPLKAVRGEVKKSVYLAKEREKMKRNKYEALFSIHGKRFTVEEFMQEFDELTPEQKKQFASFEAKKNLFDQLVVKELLMEKADDQGRNKQEREYLKKVKRAALEQMLHKAEVDEKITIPDAEAKKFYAQYKRQLVEPLKAKVSIIRVGTGFSEDERKRARKRIEKAESKLRAGADFADIAKEYSEDWTATRGGELDQWIDEGGSHLAESYEHGFHRYVFALAPDEISDFFEFRNNYWLVKMRKRVERRQQTFYEAKPKIMEVLRTIKHRKRMLEMQNELLSKSQLTVRDFVLSRLFSNESKKHVKEKKFLAH